MKVFEFYNIKKSEGMKVQERSEVYHQVLRYAYVRQTYEASSISIFGKKTPARKDLNRTEFVTLEPSN